MDNTGEDSNGLHLGKFEKRRSFSLLFRAVFTSLYLAAVMSFYVLGFFLSHSIQFCVCVSHQCCSNLSPYLIVSYFIVSHIVFADVLPVVSCLIVITRSIKLSVEPAGLN